MPLDPIAPAYAPPPGPNPYGTVAPPRPYSAYQRPQDTPVRGAATFAPLSLFGLFAGGEIEYGVSTAATAYVSLGIGVFTQLAGELGARYYVLERALDGLYVEGHGQFFAVPSTGMALLGPGVMMGWATRASPRLMMSVGFGVSLWWSVGNRVAGLTPTRPDYGRVIFLPGLQAPTPGTFAVQPTIRLQLGPTF